MKYFKIFKSVNKPIIKQNANSEKSFLVVDRERIVPVFFMSVLSAVISHKKNYKPILIGDFGKKNQINFETFKSFGFKNIKKNFNKYYLISNPLITIKTIKYFIFAIRFLKKNGFTWFINNFKIKNIVIGDLIFDTLNQSNVEDQRLNYQKLKIIFVAIFRTIKISHLIFKNNVKVIVVPTQTYCYNSGIACRIGLTNKIKVLTMHDNNYLETHTFKNIIYGPYNILYNNLLSDVKKIRNISKVEKYLKDRKNLKVRTYYTQSRDLKKANRFKNLNLSKEKFIKKYFRDSHLDKKIILIACHAFSDASNGLGTSLIFNDYYQWLNQTLRYLSNTKNNKVLFILKIILHLDLMIYK